MALSDFARHILAAAPQHPLRLAAPPDRLPAAACQAVLNSLLKQGYVEECEAPQEYTGVGWRQDAAGAWIALRVTDAGLLTIGAEPPGTAEAALDAGMEANSRAAPKEAHSVPPTGYVGREGQQAPNAANTALEASTATPASTTRATLHHAAQRILSAWEDEVSQRADLPDAIASLRRLLTKPVPAPRTAGPRKPREGTKQQQVLTLLRRPEGATVAHVADAIGWANHTVRGFFADLKRRGIEVSVLERLRQVGPNKASAKGSFTVYRVAEAG
jgi:hypothetical protein